MAEIYVKSSSDIEQVIQRLDILNGKFKEQAETVKTEHVNLTQKWEGDASTAFNEHFKAEESNFETFWTAIDEYIKGLRQILEVYETAESTNKGIAES